MREYILAIDIGTSSTRTTLFDIRGERIVTSTAQEGYSLAYSPDGSAELSPALLKRALQRCLNRTLRRGSGSRVPHLLAVGISGFWHSLLGVDVRGQPLTPIYTWADSRCRDDAAAWRERLDERAYHRRTGCMLRSSYWPAKLAWLRRTQPRLFRRVTRWVSPAEWLFEEQGGPPACSLSMASGTGLCHLARGDWDDDLLTRCHLSRSRVSPVQNDPLLIQGVPWFPAIGDGAAGNLGADATRPGLAAINYGTSAAVRCVVAGRKPAVPFGLFAYRVDERRFLVGGAVSNAGNLHDWASRVFRGPGRGHADHGLTVLPFWVNDRAPHWNEHLRGLITGLTPATTAADLRQALQEAVFYRIALIAWQLERAAGRRLRYVVSGGLVRSAGDVHTLTDVLDRTVIRERDPEASLRGAAVYALERLGYKLPARRHDRVMMPRAREARRHAAAIRRQCELERRLSP